MCLLRGRENVGSVSEFEKKRKSVLINLLRGARVRLESIGNRFL